MTDQTQPTIEQMIAALDKHIAASSAEVGVPYFPLTMASTIRAALAEKQANTLPLDIPEGCRIIQLMRYKRTGKADGYVCDLMRESDDRLFSTNAYDTWEEALRAAIKATLATQREGV